MGFCTYFGIYKKIETVCNNVTLGNNTLCKYHSSFCEHKKKKSICKICKGKYICPHDKIKTYCKLCGGKSICSHNKIRIQCKLCHGTSMCSHNRRKNQCLTCKGISICIHNVIKYRCQICIGRDICKHNKIKYQCIDCGGSSICSHMKQRNYCNICDPLIHPDKWCDKCKVKNIRFSKYKPYCSSCFKSQKEQLEYILFSNNYINLYIDI